MARRKFISALRSRRKLLGIWGLFALLAFMSVSGVNFQDENSLVAFEDQVIGLLVTLIRTAAVLMAAFLVYLFVRRHKNQNTETGSGFKDVPQHYDRRIIKIQGKVEKVFAARIEEKLRKGVTNAVRTITKDNDKTGRYVHQRFLVSSPMLRSGEKILILHNQSYGKSPVREGNWIAVQGVYIHDRSKKRGLFGGTRLTFYGKIHFTHPPKGFIQILERKPAPETLRAVEVEPGQPKRSDDAPALEDASERANF